MKDSFDLVKMPYLTTVHCACTSHIDFFNNARQHNKSKSRRNSSFLFWECILQQFLDFMIQNVYACMLLFEFAKHLYCLVELIYCYTTPK